MAIDYDNLFEDIGKLTKAANDFRNSAEISLLNVEALRLGIETQFVTNGIVELLDGHDSQFNGFKDSLGGWYADMGSRSEDRLLHPDTILDELPSVSLDSDVQFVLREIFRDMVDNSQDVLRSVVTIGSVVVAAGNIGNAQVITTGKLDGVTPPGNGIEPNRSYDGLNTQLAVTSEELTITCTNDSYHGLIEGTEEFVISSTAGQSDWTSWKADQSETNVSIQPLQASGFVSNQDFEVWDALMPVGWTIGNGTPGLHVVQETTAVDVHRGTSGVRFVGDGVIGNIRIIQPFDSLSVTPLRMMVITGYVKIEAGATGTLHIGFDSVGSGILPSPATVSVDVSTLTTSFALISVFTSWPENAADDLLIVVEWDSPSAHTIWIDSLAVGEATYVNGIGMAVTSGNIPATILDRYSLQVDNDNAGVFQEFFRRALRFQLPTVISGPSQLDSLAT